VQWYDLLRRLRLCVFHHVYGFCCGALAKDWVVREVPQTVLDELILDAILVPFGSANMLQPFLPFVGATDASGTFGHGAAIAALPPQEIRRIARHACKCGAHVCLDSGPALSDALVARLGPRHILDLALRDFQVVLSVRVTNGQHINVEEGHALIRYVKWILRSRHRFGHRVVILIDSKVVIGAVTKGRSSSMALNAVVRRIAALCFAGGLTLHCVFIPTSHNPGDWPSRGGPATWPADLRRARGAGAQTAWRLEREIEELQRDFAQVQELQQQLAQQQRRID
jgi:hypothetical protein